MAADIVQGWIDEIRRLLTAIEMDHQRQQQINDSIVLGIDAKREKTTPAQER